MAKAAQNREKTLFTSKLALNLRKKLVKCYSWSTALYGAETWTLQKKYQKYLQTLEMWCWRRMENISWTDRVRNEVLQKVKGKRNILHKITRRMVLWIGHMLSRNCLLKHVIERNTHGGIEVTRRQGRRRKQLLGDHGNEGTLEIETVVRLTTEWMNALDGGE